MKNICLRIMMNQLNKNLTYDKDVKLCKVNIVI